MRYNTLIPDTPSVSEIGLGAWQLGESADWKSLTETEAINLAKTAYDAGVNFFDTAPNYGHGSSEERLGKALKGVDRSSYVINTKFGHSATGALNFEASAIRSSLEGSLKRLQTDYVDSLIFHNPPLEYLDGNKNDHYEILDQLKEEGKIKAYGASLDTYEEMKLFMETTHGQVIEAFFNILHQDAARAFPLAQQKGVGIIAKIPLDSGWLGGKYDQNSTFDDIRSRWSRTDIQTRAKLVEQLKTLLGKEHQLHEVALAFCLAHEAVSTVIPGNKNLQQLKANIKSVQEPLPENLVIELHRFYKDEVAPLGLPW